MFEPSRVLQYKNRRGYDLCIVIQRNSCLRAFFTLRYCLALHEVFLPSTLFVSGNFYLRINGMHSGAESGGETLNQPLPIEVAGSRDI